MKKKSFYSQVEWAQPTPKPPQFLAAGLAVAAAAAPAKAPSVFLGPARMYAEKPVLDEVRALLKAAAEVEHSLLVEYLYAAYALVNFDASNAVKGIAIEEMGHLVTVQNLLAAVGGEPHMERDDPAGVSGKVEPFPFALEPPSAATLARYVLAEMPREETLPETDQALIADLQAKFGSGHGEKIRRVGQIYAALYWFFQETDEQTNAEMIPDPSLFPAGRHLAAADFAPGGQAFQSTPAEWGGDGDVIVGVIQSRQDALDAILAIAAQGEGLLMTANSHYVRFRDIYKQAAAGELAGTPTGKDVPRNPSVADDAPADSRIEEPEAKKAATNANLRYQILVLSLAQGLARRSDDPLRATLLSWALREMRRLDSLASNLPDMQRVSGQTTSPQFAAAPFQPLEAIPDSRKEQWLLQKQLHEHSAEVTGTLSASDKQRLDQVINPQIAQEA